MLPLWGFSPALEEAREPQPQSPELLREMRVELFESNCISNLKSWRYSFCQTLGGIRKMENFLCQEGFLRFFFFLISSVFSDDVGSTLGAKAHRWELCCFCVCHRYLRGRQQDVGCPELTDLCQSVNTEHLKSQGLWYEPYLLGLTKRRTNVSWMVGRDGGLICTKAFTVLEF